MTKPDRTEPQRSKKTGPCRALPCVFVRNSAIDELNNSAIYLIAILLLSSSDRFLLKNYF